MRTAIAMMMLTSAAVAQERAGSEAYQALAMRLATTYHCAPVTGDADAFERAKAAAMDANLEGEPLSADELIAAVEMHEPDTSSLTPELCSDMVQMLE